MAFDAIRFFFFAAKTQNRRRVSTVSSIINERGQASIGSTGASQQIESNRDTTAKRTSGGQKLRQFLVMLIPAVWGAVPPSCGCFLYIVLVRSIVVVVVVVLAPPATAAQPPVRRVDPVIQPNEAAPATIRRAAPAALIEVGRKTAANGAVFAHSLVASLLLWLLLGQPTGENRGRRRSLAAASSLRSSSPERANSVIGRTPAPMLCESTERSL